MSQSFPTDKGKGKPASIKIADWLAKTNRLPDPAIQVPDFKDRPSVTAEQKILKDWWDNHKDEADREVKLEIKPQECSECGLMERFYHNDYICWSCRDKLEKE